MSEDRESIWSVPVKAKRVYYSLFVAQMLIGTAVVAKEAVDEKAWTAGAARIIWTEAASVAVTSAAITLAIVEIGRFIMVLGGWLKEKLEADKKKRIEEAEERGYQRRVEEEKQERVARERDAQNGKQ